MRSVVLAHATDFAGWRDAARRLALAGVAPGQVSWSVGAASDLLADAPAADAPAAGDPAADAATGPAARGGFSVSRALVELAQTVVQARDPERFALLYTLIWRSQQGERQVLEDTADPLVRRVQRLAQSVRRDIHKMRAFLRFREVATETGPYHVAWFEPEHFILEGNAPFFMRRFASLRWSILTPDRSAHWDGTALQFGEGATRASVPDDDALEEYWRVYFRAIFNPARLKIGAMLNEMPKKYWRNLPEAAAIPELIQSASNRTQHMVESPPMPASRKARPAPIRPAADLPEGPAPDLATARAQAAACRRCDLWQHATQTVFGEGPSDARIMLVGEQPGDQEDLAGHPFVGPAGQLLDRALVEAGVDRRQVYVTNAVKHFKFTVRGKRRIHEKPATPEINACRVWLEVERAQLRPAMTVLLGATAARAVLGRAVTIARERGTPITLPDGGAALITVHPSYLLRLPDAADKAREYANFVSDLRQAAGLAAA